MITDPDQLLDVAELASYCNVAESAPYYWRKNGTGPRAVRVGRHLRYRRRDVDAWLEANAEPIPAPSRGASSC